MKYQLVFLATFACVLLMTEANPTKVCEPGTVFKKDCNECKCNDDGTDAACTRKMCEGSKDGAAPVPEEEHPQEPEVQPAQPAEGEQAEPKVDESERCTPGELFKKDCNDCTCPPSGLKSGGACTLLACLDDEIQKD